MFLFILKNFVVIMELPTEPKIVIKASLCLTVDNCFENLKLAFLKNMSFFNVPLLSLESFSSTNFICQCVYFVHRWFLGIWSD